MFGRLRTIALALTAGVAVSGCAYSDYGASGGYGGVSLGYGGGGYYDGYGGGFGSPYWGWSGDYYYPGTGYYVYDRYRRPYRWNDRQRYYWQQRRGQWRGDRGSGPRWDGWDRPRPGYDRGDRRGFDGPPGFQYVPRGSSQSPGIDRPRNWRRPDAGTPGAGQREFRRRDGATPGAGPIMRRSPGGVPRGEGRRPR
jgi:hypothetical protein